MNLQDRLMKLMGADAASPPVPKGPPVIFYVDAETAQRIDRLSERLKIPRDEVIPRLAQTLETAMKHPGVLNLLSKMGIKI